MRQLRRSQVIGLVLKNDGTPTANKRYRGVLKANAEEGKKRATCKKINSDGLRKGKRKKQDRDNRAP